MRYKMGIKQLTFISVSILRTMVLLRTYKKKSDILVALGKASDDTRYLDRAMERGEVIKLNINWVDSYAIYKEVEKYFLGILVGEVELLSSLGEDSEALEEAQANVEYYKNEAEEANDKIVALESVLDNLRAKGLDIGYANE